MWKLLGVLVLTGCAVAPATEVPLVPDAAPAVMTQVAPLDDPHGVPPCPLDRVEVVVVAPLSQSAASITFTQKPVTKSAAPVSPATLVADAAKAARVEPTERGYYANSAEHVYPWAPGRVYTVYLSKAQGTGIFLPPGEKLVSGLYLDPESYDVAQKRAGAGESAYDALVVRPTIDKGETQAFLLTESGRRYLLRLVVGQVGMLAVTFEGPTAMRHSVPSPAMALPLPRNVDAQDPRSVPRPPQDR